MALSLVWKFLSKDKNGAVLGWVGGGVVIVIGALWAAFVYFMPVSKSGSPTAAGVEANCGSVAAGGNVTGATITATGADCGAPKPK
jgi:hypothetical protein